MKDAILLDGPHVVAGTATAARLETLPLDGWVQFLTDRQLTGLGLAAAALDRSSQAACAALARRADDAMLQTRLPRNNSCGIPREGALRLSDATR